MKGMKNVLRLITGAVVVLAVTVCVGVYKKNRTSGEVHIRVEEQTETGGEIQISLLPIVKEEEADENAQDTVEIVISPQISPTPIPVTIAPTDVPVEEEAKDEQPVVKKEPEATPYALAAENQSGRQEGWGKIKSTITTALTMKSLPQQDAGSVKREVGQKKVSVLIYSQTPLKLYGLYEGERGEIYRHVGVTYSGIEYFGYILADRIEGCTDAEIESFVSAVTVTPIPIIRPMITVAPIPTERPKPVITVAPGLTAIPSATITPKPTATPVPVYEMVDKGYFDYNVIPDKFNTGCYDTSVLEKISSACTVDGVEYKIGDNGNTVVIDLYYGKNNAEMAEEVVIRNKDFSDKKLAIRNASKTERKHVIYFENCEFGHVALDYSQDMVDFYFYNCGIKHFTGSNSVFDKCFFGGSGYDGANPFQNVTIKNCYFAGYPQYNEQGKHSDAMQVFGKADIDAENILFQNCRIEIPILDRNSSRTINACFMVQLEYSNARNFLFEDCIINGGGYSIYAHAVKGDWTMNNIVFRNISIGSGHLFGDLYPDIDENIVFENLYDTGKLYVASVWKDSLGRIHLSVSNDTAEDRTLLVVTENGTQTFMIPSKATSVAAGAKEYYDLAIDMEIVPADAESSWVVCYDGEETEENQIRYVNWSGENVFREIQ